MVLVKKGLSVKKIAAELRVSTSTVNRDVRKLPPYLKRKSWEPQQQLAETFHEAVQKLSQEIARAEF